MESYGWPGNVRQIHNVIETAYFGPSGRNEPLILIATGRNTKYGAVWGSV